MRTNVKVGAEQRKHRRFNLAFPIRVKRKSQDPSAPAIETSTRDISARGIYLVISEDLEMGSELDLEITLPAELAGGKSVKLRCRGKVARLEPRNAEGKIGVGAVIQDYEFLQDIKLAKQNA